MVGCQGLETRVGMKDGEGVIAEDQDMRMIEIGRQGNDERPSFGGLGTNRSRPIDSTRAANRYVTKGL